MHEETVIERFNLVSDYMHNQTDENWETLVKSVIEYEANCKASLTEKAGN